MRRSILIALLLCSSALAGSYPELEFKGCIGAPDVCTPPTLCYATPAACLCWDQMVDTVIDGYRVYENGILVKELPCSTVAMQDGSSYWACTTSLPLLRHTQWPYVLGNQHTWGVTAYRHTFGGDIESLAHAEVTIEWSDFTVQYLPQ